jgi:hypothetical protein
MKGDVVGAGIIDILDDINFAISRPVAKASGPESFSKVLETVKVSHNLRMCTYLATLRSQQAYA